MRKKASYYKINVQFIYICDGYKVTLKQEMTFGQIQQFAELDRFIIIIHKVGPKPPTTENTIYNNKVYSKYSITIKQVTKHIKL